MRYELFSVSGNHITTFESAWRFQEGEQILFMMIKQNEILLLSA